MTETITPIDSPWKTLIEQFLKEFIAFFFPNIYHMIDWTKKYEFLDQEFQQIVRDAKLGKRLADKLVKVWKQNGKETIIYIHIEVQAQSERDFAKRMFVYHYRIFDRFDQPIVSVAILADKNDNWRPHCFGYEIAGCQLSFRFPTIKLLDYKKHKNELEQSNNIFALVVQTHLVGIETQEIPERRFYRKQELFKTLLNKKYSQTEILELFHFMDWMLKLPEELANRFDDFVKQYEAEKTMQYVTHIERKGIEKGRTEGRSEGRSEGRTEGRSEMLVSLLEEKFGTLDSEIREKVYHLDENNLFEWLKRAVTAPTLQEVIKPN